jgi:hypothetical protein
MDNIKTNSMMGCSAEGATEGMIYNEEEEKTIK